MIQIILKALLAILKALLAISVLLNVDAAGEVTKSLLQIIIFFSSN
jgi:hypothetical protein